MPDASDGSLASATDGSPSQGWLFQLPPVTGESMASLAERNADANAIPVSGYLSYLGVKRPRVDLDRGDEGVQAALVQALRLESAGLRQSTLTPLVGRTLVDLPLKGAMPWCLTSPRQGPARAVCLACCAQAQIWFRRIEWRLSYVTHCPEHGDPLLDACPSCGASLPGSARGGSYRRHVQWHAAGDPGAQITPDLSDASHCFHCGLRWEQWCAEQSASSQSAWAPYQEALLLEGSREGARDGAPWHRLGCTFAWQFLAGVRVLLAVLRSPKTGERLRQRLAQHTQVLPAALSGGGRRAAQFETYSAAQRRAALEAVAAMLDEGVQGLTSLWAECGITWSVLLQVELYAPYWLAAPVRRDLDRSRYSLSEQEIAGARRATVRQVASDGDADAEGDASAALTKVAMARLTGTRDSAALDREFGRRRRRYARQEAVSFFCRAIAAVPRVPRSRTQRIVVLRTVLLMLVVAVSDQRLEAVCGLPCVEDDVLATIAALPATLRSAANRMLQEEGYCSPGALTSLLHSRFGEPLKGATTRLVAAKLLKTCGSPHVWNSIDALSGALIFRAN
ncbi:MAG: TniQ family protein [Burkholderiaceae bacterium]